MISETKRNSQRLAVAFCALLFSACGGSGGGGGSVDVVSAMGVNDTGITDCTDGATVGLTCPRAGYPGQDAEHGRDSTHDDDTDGHAGFSFIKLDSSGTALANQAAAYGSDPWDCVEDNVTGLMWEVKATDGGLRDSAWTYTWYNSSGVNDGGDAGTANGGTCFDVVNCDTEKYVAAVNAAGLCGHSDWRMPTINELLNLADLSVASPGPAIDTGYFPNSVSDFYSSSTPYYTLTSALGVRFDDGGIQSIGKSIDYSVRLVRD